MAVQYKIKGQYYVHSELSRGVIVLHELFYQYARDQGQTDRENTRLLLSYVISNETEAKSIDLVREAIDLGFLLQGDDGEWSDYKKLAPIQWAHTAAYWLAGTAYEAYYRFDVVCDNRKNGPRNKYGPIPKEIRSEWELLYETRTISRELKIKDEPENIHQAVASLKENSHRFAKLKEPNKAEKTLLDAGTRLQNQSMVMRLRPSGCHSLSKNLMILKPIRSHSHGILRKQLRANCLSLAMMGFGLRKKGGVG